MSWQRVRGHDRWIDSFDRVVQRGRLAHAYLFVGPAGVGKRLFAGELAKAMLCEGTEKTRLEACDHCTACSLFDAGTHPDFFSAQRPDDSIDVSIDVVRELCHGFSLKPARGHGKIIILDDADDLNEAAANCILKTLEEPPPASLWLLVGTVPERQLPTIRSRCQTVRFSPLPADVVADLLRAGGIEDAALVDRLVQLADGSPGRARLLADPELWEFRRRLIDGLTAPRLDVVALAKEWNDFVEAAGKEGSAKRLRAALAVQLLVEFFRDVLVEIEGGTVRFDDRADAVPRQAIARLGSDRILGMLDRCMEAEWHIDRKVQLELLVDALVDALGRPLRAGSRAG